MPAWEAISRAGGFTKDANKKRFLLIRIKEQDAYISVVNLDFEQAFKDGTFQSGLYLNNGDVIYVPEIAIASVERFMTRLQNILAPIHTFQRMITVTPALVDALKGDSAINIIQ